MTTMSQTGAYQKRWRYERAHGILRMLGTEQARLHLAALEGAGWTARAIAAHVGTSASVVLRIKSGDQPRASRRIVEGILAVPVDQLATRSLTGEPFVSRVGTVRRIQALMVIGWSCKAMSEHLSNGKTERWLYNLLNQQGRWVTRSTHDEVARLYRELSTRPGPSEIARERARARGFAGPMEWDDIDRDAEPDRDLGHDSDRVPADLHDDAVVRRLVDEGVRVRRLTHTETLAAFAELRARGLSTVEIEREYHLNTTRGRRAAS